VKLDLNFGPVLHNFSIDIGLYYYYFFFAFIIKLKKNIFRKGFNDENNQTKRSVNVFNQQVSIEYHSNNENKIDIYEQSVTLLEPGEHLTIFISDEWIHIENKQRTQQKLTIHFNETNLFLFNENSSFTDLFIGLNRNINEKQTGIGLCSANLTFIECFTDQRMFMKKKKYFKINIFLFSSRICFGY